MSPQELNDLSQPNAAPPAQAGQAPVLEQIDKLRGRDGWPSLKEVDQDEVRILYGLVLKEERAFESLRAGLEQKTLPVALADALLMVFRFEGARGGFLRAENPLSLLQALHEAWEELRKQIQKVIEGLDDEEGAGRKGELFRHLCRLAWDWGVDPETFRQLLVGAGLAGSRASEIKRVLASQTALQKFLANKNPSSWKEALKASRSEDLGGMELAARELIRLLVGRQKNWEKESDLQDFKVRIGNSGDYTLSDSREGTLKVLLLTSHFARFHPATEVSTTKA